MNLKIIVLGTENHMYVHNFTNYKPEFKIDSNDIEEFNENNHLCLDDCDFNPSNVYNHSQSILDYLEKENLSFKEDYNCQIEAYGMPNIDNHSKLDYYDVFAHILLDENDSRSKEFNQLIINTLENQGLKFNSTEDIYSKDEDEHNKYLWLNFMIDGVDSFY